MRSDFFFYIVCNTKKRSNLLADNNIHIQPEISAHDS